MLWPPRAATSIEFERASATLCWRGTGYTQVRKPFASSDLLCSSAPGLFHTNIVISTTGEERREMSSRTVHRPRHRVSSPRRRVSRVAGAAASAAIVVLTASGVTAGVGHAAPSPPSSTSPSTQPGTSEGEGGQPGTVPSGPEEQSGTTDPVAPEDQPGTEEPRDPETAPSGHDGATTSPETQSAPDQPTPTPPSAPDQPAPTPPSAAPAPPSPEVGPALDQAPPRPPLPREQFVAEVPEGAGVPYVTYVVKHNGDVAYDGNVGGTPVRGGWTADQADAPLRALGPAAPRARKAINDVTRDLTSRAERAIPGLQVEWPLDGAKKKRAAPRHSR